MPILEFHCPSCGYRFEKLVIGSLPTGFGCPECGATDIRRVFSRFAATGTGSASGASAGEAASGCGACAARNCSSCH